MDNYTKYSKKAQDTICQEKLTEEVESSIENVKLPEEPKMIRVVNCTQVNIRKDSSTTSEVLYVVNVGTELMLESLVDGWARVCSSAGIEGYIMADFIEVI